MTRITTTVLMMMLLLNGGVTVMEASGLAEDLGVTLAPGVDQHLDATVTELRNAFDPTSSVVDSLYGIMVAGYNALRVVIEGIAALPSMLLNFGIPDWFVAFVTLPMYLVSAMELIYVATGRDMI